MSLINAVRPIIGSKTAKVVLEVSASPKVEGEMVVVARPVVGPVASNASEELKQLCAALAVPIKVIGSPDEIEKELCDAVSEQAGHRQGWQARVAELEARIASGAAADAQKAKSGSGSKKSQADGQPAPDPKPAADPAPSTSTFSL